MTQYEQINNNTEFTFSGSDMLQILTSGITNRIEYLQETQGKILRNVT